MNPDARREVDHWEAAARKDARRACWDEDDWKFGVDHCLGYILKTLRPLPNGARVLDLGAGVGRLACPLARRYPFVEFVAADASETMLKRVTRPPNLYCRQIVDGRTLSGLPLLTAAYSVLLFQHLPPAVVASYINQVADRLVSGGRFCFQYVEGQTDQFLAHDFTEPLVKQWCVDAGFETIEVEADDGYSSNWRWVRAVKP